MSFPSETLLREIQAITPHTWHIVATATSTAMGHGSNWLPSIYRHAVSSIAEPDKQSSDIPIPPNFEDDPLPRRKIVRQMKETLHKSISLIGIPKVIEAALAFGPVIHPADDDALAPSGNEYNFFRQFFELDEHNTDRGFQGLRRVYRGNLDPILARFGGLTELAWHTVNVTYGIYLSPCRPYEPSAPLTLSETEAAVVSTLVPQLTKREILWHLRGALRSGLSHKQVDDIHKSIDKVAIACGASTHELEALPRVYDVTDIDDLT